MNGSEDNKVICYLRVILRQWFSLQGGGGDYLPQGTPGYGGKHFWFSQLGSVTAPSGWRPGMQLKPYGIYVQERFPYNEKLFGPEHQ